MQDTMQKIAEKAFQDELEKIAYKGQMASEIKRAISSKGSKLVGNLHARGMATKELATSYLKDPTFRAGAAVGAGGAAVGGLSLAALRNRQ
jgi:hypothetical protein